MSTLKGSSAPTPQHIAILEGEETITRAWAISINDSLADDHPDKVQACKIIETSPCKLENVFLEDGSPRLRLAMETFEETAIPHVLGQNRTLVTAELAGSPATVTQKEFEARFAECSNGLLDGLNWTNIIAAGGSVLSCLQQHLAHEYTHADVDLFLITRDETKAMELLKHIHSVIKANVDKYAEDERYKRIEVIRTVRTITIKTAWKMFQVVTTLFSSPLEVLVGFDVDCACVATTDGKSVVTTQRGALSLQKRYMLWIADLRTGTTSERRYQNRLLKHSKKGFAVLALNADWSTLPDLDGQKIQQTKGITTLVLMDRLATLYPSRDEAHSHLFTSGIDECIHGGDSWCNTCHKKLPQDESKPDDRVHWVQPIEWMNLGAVYQDIENNQYTRASHSSKVPLDFDRYAYVSSDGKAEKIPQSPAGPTLQAADPLTIDAIPVTRASYELSSQDGIVIPNCNCGLTCTIKLSKKPGPNHNRRFFCCRNSQNENTCKFFQWEGAEMSYSESKALRMREKVSLDEVTDGIESLRLDTSKLLFAIASCFKSGRIDATQRGKLKEFVVTDNAGAKEEDIKNRNRLQIILDSFASSQDFDQLGTQLAQFCASLPSSVVQ